MDLAIEMKDLTKHYPGREALKDVSFSVKKGSIHGFLGPNGAGKSTTMKILSGLIPPTSGTFQINGRIGFLPEHPPVYPQMSVRDYLSFVFEINALKKCEDHHLQTIMQKTGLVDVQDRLVGNLSKGFQQRVGIAQAIIHSPEIIILDEPTVGLDPVAIQEIRSLILELKKEHTILFSSHQLHDVEILCSEITLINKGEIVVSGEMKTILRDLKKENTLKIKVHQFNEESESEFKKRFGHSLTLLKKNHEQDDEIVLFIKMSRDLKQKMELTQFLSQPSIGLLELVEEKAELEDLFTRMKG
jgi:ABC-2 type transport system ATP-binding protein